MRYILRARWNGEGTAFEYCETEEKRCWEKRDENFEINITHLEDNRSKFDRIFMQVVEKVSVLSL